MPVSEGKEYVKLCREKLLKAEALGYEELLKRHVTEYQRYFDRMSIKIDGEDYEHLPTDVRIRKAAEGTVDNQLVTLLFDFGRYLSITSSQPGTQPANLQGIWSNTIMPPWHSNYTMNINLEMNYWHVETCDLPECHLPLLTMIKELRERGNTFGLRGWSAWHNSDLWRFHCEATKDPLWGYWQMGGAWLCRHIWEHFAHTGDREFLQEYYPIVEEAAWFMEDWMYENKDGWLTTCPSTSPENRFRQEGVRCCVCEGSAMDMEIIKDLYDKLIRMGTILGKDVSHYQEILKKLKPLKVGTDGRLLEWGEELEECDLGHRHISHLYGFFPADVMSLEEYGDVVRKTLQTRLENGGGHTGWSNAWIANIYARLGDGEGVMKHIRNMFAKSIYPNLLDAHPPFQIDGNFGICSAVCEALMQSHEGKISLIPALPKEWKSGEVQGMVARTGEKISFRWKNGEIIENPEAEGWSGCTN